MLISTELDGYCSIPDQSCDAGSSTVQSVAPSLSDCGSSCDGNANCVAFVYSEGTCYMKDGCTGLEPVIGFTLWIKLAG